MGSRRMNDVNPVMYSPAERPSSMPARAGEEADLVDHGGDLLGHGQGLGLAGVLALGVDELLGARLDGIGDPEQGQAPLRRRGVAPSLERLLGHAHGVVDVGGAGHGHRGEDLARRGVDHVLGPALLGVDVGPTDEVPQHAPVSCHDGSLPLVDPCGPHSHPSERWAREPTDLAPGPGPGGSDAGASSGRACAGTGPRADASEEEPMRVLLVGAGGVGTAFARIAARRGSFEHIVVADHAARPGPARGRRRPATGSPPSRSTPRTSTP